MTDGSTDPNRSDLLRYALWLLVAQTAFANRRHYHMLTTWLPHLVLNSLSLLFPDLVRLMFRRHKAQHEPPQNIIEDILVTMVSDNPSYALYVTPLALGYIVSHPNFNIYKGDMGQMRFAGLGLDAIPHAATAFALSALIVDTLDKKASWSGYDTLLSQVMERSSQHPQLVSLGVLSTLTAIWEYNEYRTHQYELSLRGSEDAINMLWDIDDTKRDTVANLLGWALAMLWSFYKKSRGGQWAI
jgi:hypothetical protein